MTIGWGTAAYGFIAGTCAAIAIVFLLIGARRRQADPLMVSFGLFALVSSVVTLATIRLHQSSTVVSYVDALEIFGILTYFTLISVVVLIAVWTRAIPRWAVTTWAVATAAIGVLQVWLPNGLLTGDVEELRNVELLGEQFSVHVAASSAWRPVLEVYLLATLGLVIIALGRGYRRGHRANATIVSIAFAVFLAFATWDTFVDSGQVDTPYLASFGLLATSVGGAAYLAERSVRTDRRLYDQTIRLEEIVIRRTAALIESNRRLEEQLASQRRSARNLAVLAREFEASNALLDPDSATATTALHGLLEQLGAILTANSVELRIEDGLSAEILPPSSVWQVADGPHDAAAARSTDLCVPIEVGARRIGELVVRSVGATSWSVGERTYVELTAEHLAALIQRMELVGRVAESAVEGERQRIAMELHDSVTQQMYSVAFLADAAVHLAGDDPAKVVEPVRRVRDLIRSSLADLRALLFELRPAAFESEDLAGLIGQLAERVSSTSDTAIAVQIGPVPPLGIEVKVGMYRIAQEALNNACRHSSASELLVTLGHDDGAITLAISDDGVGFDPSEVNRGTGLGNLRARAAQIGADVDVSSRPGSGTTVEVRWRQPVPRAALVDEGAEV